MNKVVELAIIQTSTKVNGHFVLKTSSKLKAAKKDTPPGLGNHSDTYFDKDRISMYPKTLERLGLFLAAKIIDMGIDIDVIATPAIGAIKFGDAIANHLEKFLGHEILTVYAEAADVGKALSRSIFAQKVKNTRVLVAEDIWTTGGSIGEVVNAVREAGGDPVAAAVLMARGAASAEMIDVPELVVMHSVPPVETYPWDECPICDADEVSVDTAVGKGKFFIELKKAGRLQEVFNAALEA